MAVTAKIAIIGCGPGARECLTMEALAAAQRAEVLIGTARLFPLFPDLKAECIRVGSYSQETIEAIRRSSGKRIAVLVTGDPGLASLASVVIAHFGAEACQVLPGISSVQVAFARLGLSWEGARILSAHASAPEIDFSNFSSERTIAVLAGNAESLAWIAALAHALTGDWRIVVAQDLTLSSERIFEVSAEELQQLPQPLRAVIVFCRKSQR
jgi:precorrin-6y C5,15-methyltransferase (decarboxylating) CbiE subunit